LQAALKAVYDRALIRLIQFFDQNFIQPKGAEYLLFDAWIAKSIPERKKDCAEFPLLETKN